MPPIFPRDHLSAEKAEQILSGAMAVFLAAGYAGTSMDRVAAQAGVSKHTIYNHFGDKDGLFNALIERLVLRCFYIEFGCELSLEEPPEPMLRRLGATFLNLGNDPEYVAFMRLLIAESGRCPALAQLYVQKVIQQGNQVLTDYLIAHPQVTVPDPEVRSHIFFGSLVAYILSHQVLHGRELLNIAETALLDSLVTLVLSPAKAASR